jgi:hypothetical protein
MMLEELAKNTEISEKAAEEAKKIQDQDYYS